MFKFDDLINWCKKWRDIPEDPNEAFVVSYQVNIDNDDPENYPEQIVSILSIFTE